MKTKWLMWLTGLVLLICLGLFGYYIYKTKDWEISWLYKRAKVKTEEEAKEKLMEMASKGQENPEIKIRYLAEINNLSDLVITNGLTDNLKTAVAGCKEPVKKEKEIILWFYVNEKELADKLTRAEAEELVNRLLRRCLVYAVKKDEWEEEEFNQMIEKANKDFKDQRLVRLE